MRTITAASVTLLGFILNACTAQPPATPSPAAMAGHEHSVWFDAGMYASLEELFEQLDDAELDVASDALVVIASTGVTYVMDGYSYALFRDAEADQYWVLKTGGIGGWTFWRGPADAEHPVMRELLQTISPSPANGRIG